MIAALLLAVAVAGQLGEASHPPIDADYEPRVNDRALLGMWNSDSPEKQIRRTLCWTTVDTARQTTQLSDIKDDDGGISNRPDGCLVRACTPVIIKDRLTIKYVSEGESQERELLKVQVVKGD